MNPVSRRSFVAASSLAVVAPVVTPVVSGAPGTTAGGAKGGARSDGGLPPFYPSHDRDAVRTIVGRSHVDYDTVHEMVTARPELAKAAWDWGFGDWESALGAASHMGRRDIAEVLIAHGARPNLFTYAMMNQVDVVRAVCVANPGIQRQHGPHGITLLQHARHGKADAVVEYLETLGGADEGATSLPVDEAGGQTYVGTYTPEGVADARFVVKYNERRQGITLQRDDEQFRFLLRSGEHVFNPGGAASVRVTFEVRDGRAMAMVLEDGPVRIRALR